MLTFMTRLSLGNIIYSAKKKKCVYFRIWNHITLKSLFHEFKNWPCPLKQPFSGCPLPQASSWVGCTEHAHTPFNLPWSHRHKPSESQDREYKRLWKQNKNQVLKLLCLFPEMPYYNHCPCLFSSPLMKSFSPWDFAFCFFLSAASFNWKADIWKYIFLFNVPHYTKHIKDAI